MISVEGTDLLREGKATGNPVSETWEDEWEFPKHRWSEQLGFRVGMCRKST